jgi:hypothetical protein
MPVLPSPGFSSPPLARARLGADSYHVFRLRRADAGEEEDERFHRA